MIQPSTDLLGDFGVSDPIPIAETGIATVWKVTRDGADAALKIYKDGDPKNEWPGLVFLDALGGDGAVRIHAYRNAAVLMEWLDGPSLGDLSRAGEDAKATAELAQVAAKIHAQNLAVQLPKLQDNFAALLDLTIGPDWPAELRRNMGHCQSLAAHLLGDQQDIRPLHGDLHHDNIKQGARGNLAFDAKGVIGDRAYDLANAFKNPINATNLVEDADRIRRMANDFEVMLGLSSQRLLSWATAHCALSIVWSGEILGNAHNGLLSLFCQLHQDDC